MNKTTPDNYSDILEKFFHTEKVGDYTLKATQDACEYFGNPQNAFKSIHIAGTNGKGSISKMVFQILKDSGKKVGVYTSPHLLDIRERFETEIGQISEEQFIGYVKEIVRYGDSLSYFEKCAMLAFLHFRDHGCEYAIIEVGLGGRLDATNVISPELSIITSIDYDHMEFLGDTLEAIAMEKGGIIKEDTPVILYGENDVLQTLAREKNALIIIPETREIVTNLLGEHQLSNARIAYEAGKFLGIADENIRTSLLHVDHPGRLEYLADNLLIDGAHNEAGLRELKRYLDTLTETREIVYTFGLKAGKSTHLVTDIFPDVSVWHLLSGDHPMLAPASDLEGELQKDGKQVSVLTPSELLDMQKQSPGKLFVVFGSLYLIGELKK